MRQMLVIYRNLPSLILHVSWTEDHELVDLIMYGIVLCEGTGRPLHRLEVEPGLIYEDIC